MAEDLGAVRRRLDAAIPYDEEAACITIVTGATAAEVLLAFGGDPAEAPVPIEDTWDDGGLPTVALLERAGAVIAVEGNGFEGSRPEVLRRASVGGRAASIYWNVNASTRLSLASRGAVRFDDEMWEDFTVEDADLDDPELVPLFDGLDFEFETWFAACMTVAERFTGHRVEGPRPPEPLMVHRLAPHLDDRIAIDVEDDEDPSEWPSTLQYSIGVVAAGALTDAVRGAPAPVRRQVASFAVRAALEAAGLAGHPDLAATVDTLETAPVLAPAAELLIRRGTVRAYGVTPYPSVYALSALECALDADPARAALGAIWQAAAAVRAAAESADRRPGSRESSLDWREMPTPRAAYASSLALGAFVRGLFAALGVEVPAGALPVVPAPPAEVPSPPWTPAAPWPYAPWQKAVAAWTGTEVLVFGAPPDPQLEDHPIRFATASAAGAYNPVTDRWRAIAAAPFPLGLAEVAVCAGTVYLLAPRDGDPAAGFALWAYAPAADAWSRLPDPPTGDAWPYRLAAAGDQLALWTPVQGHIGRYPVLLRDPATGAWGEAPPDPWEGWVIQNLLGLADGRLVRIDAPAQQWPELSMGDYGNADGASSLVLSFAQVSLHDPGAEAQPCRAAVLDPGATSWRELPPSPVAADPYGIGGWVVAAGLVVNPRSGSTADRGGDSAVWDDDWDDDDGDDRDGDDRDGDDRDGDDRDGDDVVAEERAVGLPHGGILDVAAGRWEALPASPGLDHGWTLDAAHAGEPAPGGGDLALGGGWAYDARRRVWIELSPIPDRPHGYVEPVCVWAGDRLVVFANAAPEPRGEVCFEFRAVPVNEGWSWRPLTP